MPRNRIALVDLDHTLADYKSAIERDMEPLWAPNESKHIPEKGIQPPHIRARIELIRNQPGWWANLAPLPLGFKLLALLRKYEFCINILTQGPRIHNNAWTEKKEWCDVYVPDADVQIVRNKGLVYGKILMDDYPPYILKWLEWRPRGLVLMPEAPWNEDFEHPNVLRCTASNVNEVEIRLKKFVATLD